MTSYLIISNPIRIGNPSRPLIKRVKSPATGYYYWGYFMTPMNGTPLMIANKIITLKVAVRNPKVRFQLERKTQSHFNWSET